MNNLVTITCNQERHMMLLQAESIQKFLKPCNHYVVVNEKNVNIEAWKEILEPYYNKHTLCILSQEEIIDDPRMSSINGQNSQQILKLEIGRKIIKNDYLILDTKNFFIKPASVDEWNRYIGSGEVGVLTETDNRIENLTNKFDDVFKDTMVDYAKKLNHINLPKYYLKAMTPFKIEYRLLQKLPNDLISSILYDINGLPLLAPSEFLLYSIVNNQFIQLGKNTFPDKEYSKSSTAFYHKPENFILELNNNKIIEDIEYSNIKVWGIHRKLLDKLGPDSIKKINEYLKSKGFIFQFR